MLDPTGEFPTRHVEPLDFAFPEILAALPMEDDEVPAPKERPEPRGATDAGKALKAAIGLRGLCGEACIVAGNLRALAYLFEKALCDDGEDTLLTAASHVVLDSMRTMADRLDAIETAAAARYAPLVEARRG